MSNFTRVRETGMWTVSVLTPTELEKFDANLFKAPNFADGGTYAPTTAINIGGSGLNLTTPFFAGETTFSGVVEFYDTVAFYGDMSIGSDDTDQLTIGATEIHYASETHGGAESHAGEATFTGAVACSGTVTCSGTLIANGSTQLGNTVTDEVYISGRLRLSTELVPLSADLTITSTSHYNVVIFTTLGGVPRTVTLNYSGFSTGDIKILKNRDNDIDSITVIDQYTSTTIATLASGVGGLFSFQGSTIGWVQVL